VRKARQVGLKAAARQGYTELLYRWGPRMEWAGFQVLPSHYYSPVPSLRELRRRPQALTEPSMLRGIDLSLDGQLPAIDMLAPFAAEIAELEPYAAFEQRSSGEGYGVADAEILYAWLRATRPRRVVEVGSGVSTHYAVAALARTAQDGHPAALTCIEPFRWHGLETLGRAGVEVDVVRSMVQEVDLNVFESLERNDVLFIDSTHVVKSGSDTSFLFLEVLPRLAPGVVVHVHDIPLPFEFVHPDVILREHMFWNEVAMLRAFLMFNSEFSIRLASFWLAHYAPDQLRRAVPSLPAEGVIAPSSIWIQRNG
jgi:predicted O-methyltransferase YrrM